MNLIQKSNSTIKIKINELKKRYITHDIISCMHIIHNMYLFSVKVFDIVLLYDIENTSSVIK